jgi:UDP-glucose 4-epimerase
MKHLLENKAPQRVVLLGGAGVIGKALKQTLENRGVEVLSLSKENLDLTDARSTDQLVRLLKPDDAVVFLATITPDKGKGLDAFIKNIKMAENFCNALKKQPVSHVVYLSSDTVYSLAQGLIHEESPADPENLFGVMHLAREHMIKTCAPIPIALLRSTLIYGHTDTHNSYGPNRMRRIAKQEKKISLFGDGEELRDHIFIKDVASLISLVLFHRSTGTLNLATGQSISYKELAKKTAALFDIPIEILSTPRNNPITYRHFDVSAIYKSFPFFAFTPLDVGLKEAFESEFKQLTRTNL